MATTHSTTTGPRPPRVLAVSSGGGHWAELRRLRPAWEGAILTYVVTEAGHRGEIAEDGAGPDGQPPRFFRVPDANKSQRLRLVGLALNLLWIVLRTRPDVVISTGAAPGYFAIRFGKMLGARTIWIDSIANADQMSVSGGLARSHCDLWLTQWEHLSGGDGPDFMGSVI